MPLAFPSGIAGGAAVAKDNWNLFPFSLTVADNNNTGQNLSLLNHLVYNRNLKAVRIGSRLPTRVDRQLIFLSRGDYVPGGKMYSERRVYREPYKAVAVSINIFFTMIH